MEAKDYVLRLSLQQLALRKTTILLWTRFCSDSLDSRSSKHQSLEFLVEGVKARVPELNLHTSFADQLVNLILLIETEVKRWEKYHLTLLSLSVAKSVLRQLCWTFQVTVDYRKTAEKLLRLEILNNVTSFKLSCVYCFENEIQRFWKGLSESTKNYYCYQNNSILPEARLVSLWSCCLKGNTDLIYSHYAGPRLSFNQYGFKSAACSGNKAATEYFFQKLTIEEKEIYLMKTTKDAIRKCNDLYPYLFKEKYSDIVIYLLSQMSKTQLEEVLQMHGFFILVYSTVWPWQDLFLDIANQMWTYISVEEYRGLLTMLSYNHYNPALQCENIFIELFLLSPKHYKNALFVDVSFESADVNFKSLKKYKLLNDLSMEWFYNLFETNKSECIILVLKSIDPVYREKLIISKLGVELCKVLISEDKWFLLELFLKECDLSKESKDILKSSLMECYFNNFRCRTRISMLRKEKFLKLFCNSDPLLNKRCIEELEVQQSASPKKRV